MIAVSYYGNWKLKKSLKKQQNIDDQEMLFTAIETDNFKLAKSIFICGKMSVNCQNIAGATLLSAVCQETMCSNILEKVNFIEFLLKRKASLYIKDIYGKTAYDYIIDNGLYDIV